MVKSCPVPQSLCLQEDTTTGLELAKVKPNGCCYSNEFGCSSSYEFVGFEGVVEFGVKIKKMFLMKQK